MISRNMIMLLVLLILLIAGSGVFLYPRLPEPAAIHWNAEGQADGYSSRLFVIGFMPLVILGMVLLLLLLPSIDPLKVNLTMFRCEYNWFVIFLTLFMGYVHILTLIWNIAQRVDMVLALVPAFAAMNFIIGILLAKARRNWFIGIRTPWTLSSDLVWDSTHRHAGLWFKIAGAVTLLGLIFTQSAFQFLIIPLIIVSLFSVAFSYIEYHRQIEK